MTYIAELVNLEAVVAPTVNDDTTLGYAVGSLWLNLLTGILYKCSDATEGAAVWDALTATMGDLAGLNVKSTQQITDSFGGLFSGGTSGFIVLGGDTGWTSGEGYCQMRMPACTVKALNAYAGASGNRDATLTIRKNGVDTGIVLVILAGEVSMQVREAADVVFAEGDLLSVALSVASGGTGKSVGGLTLELETGVA